MVIKNRALKLRGYKKSKIITLTHTHTVKKKSYITLSFIF